MLWGLSQLVFFKWMVRNFPRMQLGHPAASIRNTPARTIVVRVLLTVLGTELVLHYGLAIF